MTVDVTELRVLARDLHAAPGRIGARMATVIRKGENDVVHDAKILAPDDTGFMESTIDGDIIGDGRMGEMGFEAGPTAEYAPYVEYDTEAHVIRPKNGSFLVFMIGGRKVFVRQVNHPGTTAQPFMGPSFDRNLPGIVDGLADGAEGAVLG